MSNTVDLRPVVALPFPNVENLNLEWLSTTTTRLTAGRCWDSTGTFGLTLTDDTIIDGSVNGVNGLDTGSLANASTYAVFVIGQQTGYNAPATLLSLSYDNPTMPEGYDLKRRVGFRRTNGSAEFWKDYQSGNGVQKSYFWNVVLNLLAGGAATSLTEVDVSPAFPAIDGLVVEVKLSFTPNTASNSANVVPLGGEDIGLSSISGVVASETQVAVVPTMVKLDSGVPKIEYKVTEATDALTIDAVSFIDNL